MPIDRPPEPWRSFLKDLNKSLRAPIELHCLGGFVATLLYGLLRPTADVDYLEVRPDSQVRHLQEIAGMNSLLHRKHGLYLQRVTVVSLPDSYEDRLRELFPGAYKRIRLCGLDPYDLALSKLERNSPVDRQDVGHLARAVPLEPRVLQERYEREMRPNIGRPDREDQTLRLWLDEYFPPV